MLKEIKGIIIECLYHGKFLDFVLDFVNSFAKSIPLLFYITKRPFLFQTHEKQKKKKKWSSSNLLFPLSFFDLCIGHPMFEVLFVSAH